MLERMSVDDPRTPEEAARAWADLASAVLERAAGRGFTGNDPFQALAVLGRERGDAQRLVLRVVDVWLSHTDLALDDPELGERLGALGEDPVADLELAEQLIDQLGQAKERGEDRVATILDLEPPDQPLRPVPQAEVDLQALAGLLTATMAELGVVHGDQEPPHRLLALLVRRFRDELGKSREALKVQRQRHVQLLEALHAAAQGRQVAFGRLGDDRDVVTAVADLVTRGQERAEELRSVRGEREALRAALAAAEGERDQARAQLDRIRVTEDEDQRLGLYRQAFAAFERGDDPQPALAAIRERERVLPLAPTDAEAGRRALERCLGGLAAVLAECYPRLPVIADPRRFKPRLLGANAYRFKTVAGLLQATADATGDLASLLAELHRRAGRRRLLADLAGLREALAEMVRLVGDCRALVDRKPTLSMSVRLDTSTGLASLPAILAADIGALLKARGGKKHAPAILPLFDECCQAYRSALVAADIGPVPAPPEPGKREREATRLGHLAEHLLDLARTQRAIVGDGDDAPPEAGEKALVADRDLLRRGLQEADAAVQAVAGLPGAPQVDVPPLGEAGDDLGGWSGVIAPRAAWLADVADYRIQEV